MSKHCFSIDFKKVRKYRTVSLTKGATLFKIDGNDDEDHGGEGVLLSSDLCFHFLAAEKIFVLKLIAFYILTNALQ